MTILFTKSGSPDRARHWLRIAKFREEIKHCAGVGLQPFGGLVMPGLGLKFEKLMSHEDHFCCLGSHALLLINNVRTLNKNKKIVKLTIFDQWRK